jgi:hypothetical protein
MFLPNKYSNAAIEYSNNEIIKFEYSNYSNNFNNTNFYLLFFLQIFIDFFLLFFLQIFIDFFLQIFDEFF